MMNNKFEHDDLVSEFNKEKDLKKWYKMFKVYQFNMGDGSVYYIDFGFLDFYHLNGF